jgi:photosystem II stability/assembly factor-like uncharacterized protein
LFIKLRLYLKFLHASYENEVIMSEIIRKLGVLIVFIAVIALGACSEDNNNSVSHLPDCNNLGAIGPASRTVAVNTLVQLEIDVVPSSADYSVSWSLESPNGSSATLDAPHSETATNSFTPDIPGEYRVSRTVEFFDCGELNHTATITAVEGPVADASATKIFWNVGSTVTLDGSASSANVATWTWTVVSRSNQLAGVATPPNGSGETFTFTLDEPNIIEYELVVSDGSLADTTRVTVRSNSPSVSALTPNVGSIGDRVVIDGANFSPTASYLHNKVTFNGVVAAFVSGTSASVNQLEVYVPANATSGPVLVEVPGTGDAGGGRHFEITAAGAWELVHDGGNNLFYGVHVVDSNIATAVGDVIVRTENGGQDWITQTAPGGTLTLQDVHFVDANTGYAVGKGSLTGGLVLRTTNGGQQWDEVNGALNEVAVSSLMGVSVIDANTATVVGINFGSTTSRIFRTTDGGTSWNDQTTDPDIPTSASLLDVHFLNANLGFVVGRNELLITKDPLILRTTDGGGDWTLAAVPPALTFTTLYAVHFADASNGWAVGRGSRDGVTNNAIILHTADGGFSWAEQGEGQIGGTNTLLLDVFFTDIMTGWIVSPGPPNPMVFRTEDGGVTWIQEFDVLGSIVGGEGIGFGGNPVVGYLLTSNPGLIWRRQ